MKPYAAYVFILSTLLPHHFLLSEINLAQQQALSEMTNKEKQHCINFFELVCVKDNKNPENKTLCLALIDHLYYFLEQSSENSLLCSDETRTIIYGATAVKKLFNCLDQKSHIPIKEDLQQKQSLEESHSGEQMG